MNVSGTLRAVASRLMSLLPQDQGPGPFICAIAVVVRGGGCAEAPQRLLMFHRRDGAAKCAGHWLFPGGFVSPSDKSVESAMRRELREETGLDASFVIHIGNTEYRDERGRLYLGVVYRVNVPDEADARNMEPNKHDLMEWVDPLNPPAPLLPGSAETVVKWFASEVVKVRTQ